MEREKLGSRLGFILLSAGCAIGIGNVWKFPYMAGQYGGGFFVLIYLFFLFILGLPIMTMEFAMGRASQKSPVKMLKTLEKPGQKWHLYGYFALAGNLLLMMFYTVVCGWMLQYFVNTAKGDFVGLDTAGVEAAYDTMVGNWPMMLVYTAIVIAGGFAVCSFSLQKGLERVSKYLMLVLLVIMLVLAVNSCFLDGAAEGLRFYLVPNWDNMKAAGPVDVIAGAMTQSFFTLSLGIGSMAIFGSYLSKDRALLGESVNIAVLDTFVAIVSGLIIFPACFAYGVDVNAGPPLIFVTLPNIFNNLAGGRIWGSLFFVFLFFAAFSTVLAVFENIIAMVMDMTGWSRKKTCLIGGVVMFVLALPCLFGYNLLKDLVRPFGGDSNIQTLEDFLVSNLLLPAGSFIFAVFCVSRYGWGFKKFQEEANEGKGLKVKPWMRVYMTYVLPVIIVLLFFAGLYTFFTGK